MVKIVPNLFIKTFGCQMNVYDSQKIVKIMAHAFNMVETQDPNEADLILLNTCSVRAKAEEKVFSDLGRLRKIKLKKPTTIIGVCGCVASQERDKIFARAPYVDLVFGPQALHLLPKMYQDVKQHEQRIIDTTFYHNDKFHCEEADIINSPSAFVTIMEGCNNFCSYCAVPFTRGREISRPLEEVLAECEKLCAAGVSEINFLGQNVNSYHGATKNGGSADLATLLLEAAKIDQLKRLRFTTSHPKDFNDSLIAAFTTTPKIVNQLHLPVQSGSNRILKLMRRGYSVEEYQDKIARLRHVRQSISVTSDFIVGFPGETEEDFQATLDLVKAINFDTSYSFMYSRRPNTKALQYQDDVPLAVKKSRLFKLQDLLHQQEQALRNAMLHSVQYVLVMDVAKNASKNNRVTNFNTDHPRVVPTPEKITAPNEKPLLGRTENNRLINFNGRASLIGQIVPVTVTEILPNRLYGNVAIIN